jgi:hypothetical protein
MRKLPQQDEKSKLEIQKRKMNAVPFSLTDSGKGAKTFLFFNNEHRDNRLVGQEKTNHPMFGFGSG